MALIALATICVISQVVHSRCKRITDFGNLAEKLFDRNKEILGEGGFGVVFKTELTIDHKTDIYAIKYPLSELDDRIMVVDQLNSDIHSSRERIYNPTSLDKVEPEIKNEIKLSEKISGFDKDGKYFMKFAGCVVIGSGRVIIIQKLLFRDFYKLSRESNVFLYMDLAARLKLYGKLIAGMQMLHSKGLAHCDIKLENIMMSGPDMQDAKFIDFGMVTTSRCTGGTSGYLPPENTLLSGPRDLHQHQDVFALGVLIIEMEETRSSKRKSPFYKMVQKYNKSGKFDNPENYKKTYEKFKADFVGELWEPTDWNEAGKAEIVDQFFALLENMVDLDYKKRITMKQAHEKMKGILTKLDNLRLPKNDKLKTILELEYADVFRARKASDGKDGTKKDAHTSKKSAKAKKPPQTKPEHRQEPADQASLKKRANDKLSLAIEVKGNKVQLGQRGHKQKQPNKHQRI